MRVLAALVLALVLPGAVDSGQENPACESIRLIRGEAVFHEAWLEGMKDAFEKDYMNEPRGTTDEAKYAGALGAFTVALAFFRHGGDDDAAGMMTITEAAVLAHGCAGRDDAEGV